MGRYRSGYWLAALVGAVGLIVGGVKQNTMSEQKTQHEKHIEAEAATTFFDGTYAEFFVVTTRPDARRLVTTEFYERRPDLGEIEQLKQVDWGIVVPEKADLFVATSGLRRNYVNAFWVGWQQDDSLYALSVFQERPVGVEFGSNDVRIHPAVVDPDGRMNQYFWRPEEQGWALCRHVFTGELGEPGTAETQRLLQVPHRPVLSTGAPVPGSEKGTFVVAWAERNEEGMAFRSVRLDGRTLQRLTSTAIPAVDLLPDQRLALHVVPGGNTAWVSGTVQFDATRYGLLEVRFDFVEEETSIGTAPLRQPTNAPLHAAQAFYYHDPEGHRRFVGLLDEEGTLAVGRSGDEEARVLRREVPLSYDFPILTSLGARYEAGITEEGEIVLVPIP